MYGDLHLGEGVHARALRHVGSFVDQLGIESVLDVGTGTGRAVAHLLNENPSARCVGVEPVFALLRHATQRIGGSQKHLVQANGYALPFRDASFDAVCAFGVLHHVSEPSRAVDEMMRVARRAVFVSDSNRFGQGPFWARVVKLAIARAGLWGPANFLKNGGHWYSISAGDGLTYSYSVFDSLTGLTCWADRTLLIPTEPPTARSWLHPLLTTGHVLMCGIRDRAETLE